MYKYVQCTVCAEVRLHHLASTILDLLQDDFTHINNKAYSPLQRYGMAGRTSHVCFASHWLIHCVSDKEGLTHIKQCANTNKRTPIDVCTFKKNVIKIETANQLILHAIVVIVIKFIVEGNKDARMDRQEHQ